MNSKVLEELNDGYDEVLVVDEANEPEEEMGAARQDQVQDQDHDQDQEEEQYEEIDPKDISRCYII